MSTGNSCSHATAAAQTVLPHLTILPSVPRAALTGPTPASALTRAQVPLTEATCLCVARDVTDWWKGSAVDGINWLSIGLCTLDCSDAVSPYNQQDPFWLYIGSRTGCFACVNSCSRQLAGRCADEMLMEMQAALQGWFTPAPLDTCVFWKNSPLC